MKIGYYISWSFCLAHLCLFLFAPMAGPHSIIMLIERGLFGEQFIKSLFGDDYITIGLLLDKIAMYIYFGANLLGVGSIFLNKLGKSKQYRIGIGCGAILVFMIVISRLLTAHL